MRPGLARQHRVVAVPDGADFGGVVVVAHKIPSILIGSDVAEAALYKPGIAASKSPVSPQVDSLGSFPS